MLMITDLYIFFLIHCQLEKHVTEDFQINTLCAATTFNTVKVLVNVTSYFPQCGVKKKMLQVTEKSFLMSMNS